MQKKNILIVYAHPEPKSINGGLFETALTTFSGQGHDVDFSDLYQMNFNARSDRHNFKTVKDPEYFKQQMEEAYATSMDGFVDEIEREIQKIERCDLMLWQFPLWWFSLPALLKGWVDRVFAWGRSYGPGQFYEKGLWKGKKAVLSLTVGADEFAYSPKGLHGEMAGVLRHIHRGMLEFTGFTVLKPHIVYAPARKTKEELNLELQTFAGRLKTIFDEEPMAVGRY